MELTRQPKKIPVYLHIPKNAGTYIEDVLLAYFSRVTNEPKEPKSNYFIKRITVETASCNLTIMVRFSCSSAALRSAFGRCFGQTPAVAIPDRGNHMVSLHSGA